MGVADKIQRAKEMKLKKQKRQNRITSVILFFAGLSICVGLFFGYRVLHQYLIENAAEQGLQDIKSSVNGGRAILPDDAMDILRKLYGDKAIKVFDAEYLDRLSRRIDFDELLSINPDASRWLWIPDTNIDYYVMQEPKTSVYSYLWKDIYRRENGTGSLLTPHVPGEQDDAHLLIFGHRMYRRDLMFTNLTDWRNKSFAEEHPYVMLYYPDHSECWHVWMACNAQGTSDIYKIPFKLESEEYANMLNYTKSLGTYELTNTPDSSMRTLYLSTCDKSMGDVETRFIVVCVPGLCYYYDSQTFSIGPMDG